MRVLIQGAGAVAAAGGALLIEQGADVAAVSRRDGVRLTALRRHDGARRPVSVISYREILPGTMDLLITTSAPSTWEPAVAEALAAARPPIVAIATQGPDDVARARQWFPDAELVLLGPTLLSHAVSRGDDVRAEFWVPPLVPPFAAVAVAGAPDVPRRIAAAFPRVIVPAPALAVAAFNALLVPFAAELAAAEGDWTLFRRRLRRPARAAAEAVRAVTGFPAPVFPPFVVRAGLTIGTRAVPFDLPAFAGEHFVRHAGQSLRAVDGWRASAGRPTPQLDSLRADLRAALPPGGVVQPAKTGVANTNSAMNARLMK